MLAGHPALFSPPEMFLANFETMAAREAMLKERFWLKGGLRRALMELDGLDVGAAKAAVAGMRDMTVPEVYAALQARIGARALVDKNPALAATPEALPRLESWFDGPRYLWIVRHPGSVIRSYENMPMAEVMLKGFVDDVREVWVRANKNLKSFLEGIPGRRWHWLRYEDLVRDTRETMEGVCRFLGLDFHPAVLDPYRGERMITGPKGARAIGDPNMAGRGRVQPELADKWLTGFDPATVGPETHSLASELGYNLGALAPPPLAGVTAGIRELFDAADALEGSIRMAQDVDAVEGRRFLLRMLSASVDTFVEHNDVERPRFHHAEGPHRKMFADCPDADYLRAPIRLGGGRAYRLSGRLPPGTLYVGVLLYGKGGRVSQSLVDDQLVVGDDGRFALTISPEDPGVGGAWLRAAGDENAVMVRQYFTDRAAQAPIEVSLALAGAPAPPAPLDAGELAAQLVRSKRMLQAIFQRTLQSYQMVRQIALNRFVEVPADQLFPTPDNRYLVAWYRFGRDQVMLVRGQRPDARYFGFSLCNAWMESLDYLRHRVNLNHAEIVFDDDGEGGQRYELCLAHRDPGHPNWLDTAGHRAGYLLVRHLRIQGEPPTPSVQVMYETEWAEERARREAADAG